VVALAVTVLLVVVVGTPRFAEFRDVDPDLVGLTDRYNGWDMSYEGDLDRDIRAVSFDVYSYHAYVEHFRGEFDRYPIFGPWRWRLLPSWVAAWLPIDNPADAYATVSMAFLAIGGAALVAVAALHGLELPGGRPGRHGRTTHGAVVQTDLDLDGRVATGVQDLAGDDRIDDSHDCSFERMHTSGHPEPNGKHRPTPTGRAALRLTPPAPTLR